MATSRSKPLFRYRITRLGFHFLFVALFAMIGGSLRGFNLLLVLAGLLISIVLLQWRQGRHAIRRVRLDRHELTGVFAGTPMAIRYEITNAGRLLPLWCLRIEDRVIAPDRVDVDGIDESGDDQQPIRQQPVSLVGSVGNVPAGQTRGTSVMCRFHRRGRYQLGPVVVSTTFPFCLMNCERLSPVAVEPLYVYPRLITLRRGWKSLLPPRRGGDGHRSTGGSNEDGEFFGLRPWQSGDHIKHIHWRTTARIGEPAVRQFEQRNRHQICLVVDAVDRSDAPGIVEQVLEVAATLINELASPTSSVALLVADASPGSNVDVSIGADATALLERLAIAKPVHLKSSQDDPLAHAVADRSSQLQAYDLVVVSARGFKDTVHRRSADPSGRQALSVWRYFDQRSRLSWIDVSSPPVRRWLAGDADRVVPDGTTEGAGYVHH
ncbi:hypothetical protein Enr13x_11100 [Stieleria neptunia]|uniref:DUF58 domain-containing protein n=1 Tax=Stieleria neptunia TaxID=2527979 RepID=A0A518HK71_9BACT|nr:DUF58 domain-containing protein [Stieleria neptunia]QDV41272.1 hypothetical protein Enr13x_11100 [Stieleria neptunia]